MIWEFLSVPTALNFKRSIMIILTCLHLCKVTGYQNWKAEMTATVLVFKKTNLNTLVKNEYLLMLTRQNNVQFVGIRRV